MTMPARVADRTNAEAIRRDRGFMRRIVDRLPPASHIQKCAAFHYNVTHEEQGHDLGHGYDPKCHDFHEITGIADRARPVHLLTPFSVGHGIHVFTTAEDKK